MIERSLGESGISVSAIGLGCMGLSKEDLDLLNPLAEQVLGDRYDPDAMASVNR